MTPDYVEANRRERERLRRLVERLDDAALRRQVTDEWTVADMLGHIAFWDARVLSLATRLARGGRFTESDVEPEDVTWINDAAWRLIRDFSPRDVAALAVRLAEETDALVARLPAERMWPADPNSVVNPIRADHRAEHLDMIEAALSR
jgi:hypothetical protein